MVLLPTPLAWAIIIISSVYFLIQFDRVILHIAKRIILWAGRPEIARALDFALLSVRQDGIYGGNAADYTVALWQDFDHTTGKRRIQERSPIARLPLEVLGEIFLHCRDNSSTFLRPRKSEAPILLCNISRLWRFTALSTPGLWTSISVTYNMRLRPNRSLIRTWVKRSKGAPLSFEIIVEDTTSHFPSYEPSIQAINEIFLLFLFQFERWQHVRIVVPLAAHLGVERICPQGVSMLQSLHIQINDSPEALEFLSLLTDRSRQLDSLTWRLRNHRKPPISDDILQYLTELHLECLLSPAQCLVLLKTCPNLGICKLENVCIASPINELRPHTASPFTHRSIRTLRVESTVDVSSLLACLTLPSLISLAIVVLHRMGPWAPWQLSRLLSRSSPPLESLLLENVPIEEDEMVVCLVSLPTLVRINITSESFMLTDKIVLALGDHHTSPAEFACPKLKVIKLCGSVMSTDGVFLNMVAARWTNARFPSSHISCLKTVWVEFCNGPHFVDVWGLKDLRAEGLNTRIFSSIGNYIAPPV